MSELILEKAMSDIGALGLSQLEFNWHGGEPLLAGRHFFNTALRYQRQYIPPDCGVKHSLQTNGTLLDMDWVHFFDEHSIGVGLSIDGPEDIHDFMRPYANGGGSFSSVMKGVSCLRKSVGHNRDIHALPVISKHSLPHSNRIFSFFVNNEIFNFAFTPCFPKCDGLSAKIIRDDTHISDREFAIFMTDICRDWFRLDDDRIEIRFLSEIAKMILDGQSKLCIFQRSSCCAKFITIDALGDVYPCDCYMSHGFLLGNLTTMTLSDILRSRRREDFSNQVTALPVHCAGCKVFPICGGGCSFYRYFPNRTFTGKGYYCNATKKIIKLMQSSIQGGAHNAQTTTLSH